MDHLEGRAGSSYVQHRVVEAILDSSQYAFSPITQCFKSVNDTLWIASHPYDIIMKNPDIDSRQFSPKPAPGIPLTPAFPPPARVGGPRKSIRPVCGLHDC
jgi:hypothetical protein